MTQINFLGNKIFNLTSQALHVELKRLAKSERAKSAHVMVECKKKSTERCAHLFGWQWVDYSNRFGFGFQLSDKSVGLLFNDSTRIGCTKDR